MASVDLLSRFTPHTSPERARPLSPELGSTARTALLLAALSALFVSVGAAFGPDARSGALLLALALNAGAYFYADRMVLTLHDARPLASPEPSAVRLLALLRPLAAAASIPTPRLFVIECAQPNAFSTGRDPEHASLVVTRGLLEQLSPRELRAVLAHEVAHIQHRDGLLAGITAVLAGGVTWTSHAAALFGLGADTRAAAPSGAETLLLAAVAPFAVPLLRFGMPRSRELAADARAAELTGDPHGLVSALQQLEQGALAWSMSVEPSTAGLFMVSPFASRSGVLSLFSSQPPVAERVRRLREGTAPNERQQ